MTPSDGAKLVSMLLAAYPAGQFGNASAGLYERELADLDVAAASAAVTRLVRSSKWLPTISEIRSAAAELAHGPRRLGAEGWGDVTDAVRRVGSYRPAPEFTDPIAGECVRLLGWQNLCLGTNESADRARFIELYDGLAARARANVVAAPGLSAPSTVARMPAFRAPRLRAVPDAAPVVRAFTAGEIDAAIGGKP